jgi:16S rRNA (cytosine1402-N4)-methyltransferase
MLAEVLECLRPQPGDVIVDCTVGFAGHALELLSRAGPAGKLIGMDLDGGNLEKAQQRLAELGHPFTLHQGNFAGLPQLLGQEASTGCDCLIADLGMSSMQIDDPARGFSFARDGPLDMRMDSTRGRTAANLLATMPEAELAAALRDLGDEPEADKIAAAIVRERQHSPFQHTGDLRELVERAAPVRINRTRRRGEPTPRQQKLRPVARVFQALRILVNRELANLQELLRVLPWCLKPGGRAAIISFHSGEDRLVKNTFREGHRSGAYAAISDEAIRSSFEERTNNPRARSAKLRWALRAEYSPAVSPS